MIGTVVRIGWLNLKRDRVAQALTFLLPIVFFSIFALVFGGGSRSTVSRVRVALVDEDGSDLSRRIAAAMERESGLRVRRAAPPPGAPAGAPEVPVTRARAEEMVRSGELPVAVILPRGFRVSWEPGAGRPEVEILSDASDPIAAQVVAGLLQKTVMIAAPDAMMADGLKLFEQNGGPFTPEQRRAVDAWLPHLRESAGGDPDAEPGGEGVAGEGGADGQLAEGLVSVRVTDVMTRKGGKSRPIIAFYAAGIGVMFLLFSCSGAGGMLLEEVESGTLERLLGSRLGMGRLLLGKWLFLGMMGFLQIAVMFVWAMLVFGLDLLSHLAGFAVMTGVTAAAAGAFGLVLAALSRSRAQLSGISTIVILSMSAVGGSMFPRFLMSETMQQAGLVTFNAWALDGYVKVFWRDAAPIDLWPQVLVLASLTGLFLGCARLLARRWESL
jgi:ABC-2 type transport system permease protein